MKCPVCKSYVDDSAKVCKVCGFNDIHREFITMEDAKAWESTVDAYRKAHQVSKIFIPRFYDYSLSQEDLAQDYLALYQKIERNPLDYKARNRLIDLLRDKACEGSHYQCETWEYDYEAEKADKIKAFSLLREITGFYRQKKVGGYVQAERMEAWSILKDAECSLFLGDLFRALQCYKEFLEHSLTKHAINSMRQNEWWTDEFSFSDMDTILHVLYNMARIFEWTDNENKTKALYNKYKNIMKLKYDSVHRISLKEDVAPDTKRGIQEEAEILCGFAKGEDKLFTLSGSNYFRDIERSLFDIGFEHPEEPLRIDVDNDVHFIVTYDEIVFHDGIYDTGFARLNKSEIDFDTQCRKISLLM